jgi:ATP-dependent exoDNAse (exonuclease V) alpha subunit
VKEAAQNLDRQGRVHEIPDREARLSAIARDYAREPTGTLVISPDNESRRELNVLIHQQMQQRGDVSPEEHRLRILDARQEMTGADRQWAMQYQQYDVIRYTRGSKLLGIEAGEYARVERVEADANQITVRRENGERQTYDPRRLSGVAVYRENERAFSEGDRVQFTAPSKDLHVANRELGTVGAVGQSGDVRIRLDSGREVEFNIRHHPHLDHGYAVTSHSSQGQTAERVLIHVDTDKCELLVNSRFAYVSISRARTDAQIYTNDKSELGHRLSREISHQTAIQPDGARADNSETTAVQHHNLQDQVQQQGVGAALG